MKTVRVALPVKQWGSLNTKYRPASTAVGDDEFTDGSVNFETNAHGVLTKSMGGINYNATPLTAAPKDQYEAVFSDGIRHLLAVDGGRLSYSPGGGTFTQVASGYTSGANFEMALYQDRVYMGNGNQTKVYDRGTSYGGVTYASPPYVKDAGAQAPSAAVVQDGETTGSVPTGTYYYKVTFLYYGAEESNGNASPLTVTVAAGPVGVKLQTIPVGGYGVTAREIYRSSDGVVYRHVLELADNTTTTATDTAASGDETIPSDNGVPPAFSLIVNHKDRNWMAGVAGHMSTLYYTEAGQPDIVASDDFITCNPSDPITAIVVFYDRVIVFNRRSMGQIVGDTPDTFAYQALPGNVGCVDNRTIQTRVVGGVPTLVWYASNGIYEYNGATVNYISDKIEDLVNFNIQQGTQVKGQNAQASQAAFQADTASGGIDLTTAPGTITTKNPKETWQTQAAWENATAQLTNVATSRTLNKLEVPTVFSPLYTTGTFTPAAVEAGGNLTLTAHADFTGESHPSGTGASLAYWAPGGGLTGPIVITHAVPFVLDRAGALPGVSAEIVGTVSQASDVVVMFTVYADSFGAPGTSLGAVPYTYSATTPSFTFTASASLALALSAGTYWLGVSAAGIHVTNLHSSSSTAAWSGGTVGKYNLNGGSWITEATQTLAAFTFVQTAVPAGGQWVSEVYDSGCACTDGTLTFSHAGTYPAGASAQTILEATADDPDDPVILPTWATLGTTSNLNGDATASVSATSLYRYFRLRVQVAASDDRLVPVIGPATLKFATTGVWVSQEIDCTAGVSAYVSAALTATTPSGTTAVLEVASATTTGGSYSSYAVLGSTPLRRFVKLRITLTANTAATATPSVTSLIFTYTISANIVSSVIDCLTTPAGWDVFQSAGAENGGTIVWEMKAAAALGTSVGQLDDSGNTYTVVTPGTFPTLTPYRYARWRISIVSDADAVPTVTSVVVNWFVAQVTSLRAASLFFNKTYFLAVAEAGSSTNNIVLAYDWQNNWRKRDDLTINTFGFFFNDPYYGSAASGQLVRWQLGVTNADESNVALDIRTKGYDFGDDTHRKVLRKVFTTLGNTGATWAFTYSLDMGQTWLPLYDDTGATSVTTPPDGIENTHHRWVPAAADLTGAAHIMLRGRSSDAHAAELHEMHVDVVIREGEILA